jgi:hypothetical protein
VKNLGNIITIVLHLQKEAGLKSTAHDLSMYPHPQRNSWTWVSRVWFLQNAIFCFTQILFAQRSLPLCKLDYDGSCIVELLYTRQQEKAHIYLWILHCITLSFVPWKQKGACHVWTECVKPKHYISTLPCHAPPASLLTISKPSSPQR